MTAAFKCGDVREDGYVFSHYRPTGHAQWYSQDSHHKNRVAAAVRAARRRALEKGLPVDIDAEYAQSLFPADGLCPALGIQMSWGSAEGRSTSPSLDRIVPSKGYVRGNVQWISHKANSIKSDATPEEVGRVAQFLIRNDYR